jgi:hypothetical protein
MNFRQDGHSRSAACVRSCTAIATYTGVGAGLGGIASATAARGQEGEKEGKHSAAIEWAHDSERKSGLIDEKCCFLKSFDRLLSGLNIGQKIG